MKNTGPRQAIAVRTASAAALLSAVLLAACSSTSSPPPVLLTLPSRPIAADPPSSAALPGRATSSAGSAPVLAVRRISIPEYLVARRVRYRAESSTIAEWPNTFWAERIEVGISREFMAALRGRLPGLVLCEASCGDQLPTLSLQIDVAPLDYVRSARRLDAEVRISVSSTGPNPHVLQSRQETLQVTSDADAPQAQAEAMSRLLAQVAETSAALVRTALREPH